VIFDPFMDQLPSHRTLSGSLCLVALGALAFALSTGCGKSEAATSRGSAPEAANVAAGAKAETDNYIAEIKAAGDYKAGAEGTVEVTLSTKGDYHINKQYPYKFKATDPAPDGITFPKPVLARADGTFEEKRGSFKVPFVVAKAGRATVSGTLYLSVCSDANCMMDKVPLELGVDVK
jgi:hypothetical protein